MKSQTHKQAQLVQNAAVSVLYELESLIISPLVYPDYIDSHTDYKILLSPHSAQGKFWSIIIHNVCYKEKEQVLYEYL